MPARRLTDEDRIRLVAERAYRYVLTQIANDCTDLAARSYAAKVLDPTTHDGYATLAREEQEAEIKRKTMLETARALSADDLRTLLAERERAALAPVTPAVVGPVGVPAVA